MIDINNINNIRNFSVYSLYDAWGMYQHGDGINYLYGNWYGDGNGQGEKRIFGYGDGNFFGFHTGNRIGK